VTPHDPRNPCLAHVAGGLHDRSFAFLAEQHPPRREQDQHRERIRDPVDAFDEGDARDDHHRPEDQRARHPEPQDTALIFAGDMKLGKDDQEHEDVVDRQRLLEKICRVIFDRSVGALRSEDPKAERHAQSNPHDHPPDVPETGRGAGAGKWTSWIVQLVVSIAQTNKRDRDRSRQISAVISSRMTI